MSIFTTCTKGDDAPCKKTVFGDDGCCNHVKILEAPSDSDMTETQKAMKNAMEAAGLKTGKGDVNYFCGSLKANVAAQDEGTNGIVTATNDGWKTKYYCDGASLLQATVATIASLAAMSAF